MNHIVATTTLLIITSGLITTGTTTTAFIPVPLQRRQLHLLQPLSQPQQQQRQRRQSLYILDNPILGESSTSSPPPSPRQSPPSDDDDDNTLLSTLCQSLNVTFPSSPLVFSSSPHRPRGLITTSPLSPNDPILLIPLSSCLTSDDPLPRTFNDDDDDDDSESHPSEWAVHLAALLLLSPNSAWNTLLPSPSTLRSTLPVHWDDVTLSHARSSALELMADAAYFSRAAAVDALLELVDDDDVVVKNDGEEDDTTIMSERIHYVLDLVQTRACRVDRLNSLELLPQTRPLRVVAPVFDFLNHGGRCGANAAFGLEEEDEEEEVMLVVRATRRIDEGEEVLLDYGESARPSWRCLANYGFLMEDHKREEEEEMEEEEEDVAEVFLNGVRYEVGRDSVPVDMVEAMADLMREEECRSGSGSDGIDKEEEEDGEEERGLTAGVALRIAKRVSDVAFDLLMVEDKNDGMSTATPSSSSSSTKAEETIVAEKLAERLRWRQHRVLMACATGLREYASEKMGME